MFEGISGDLKPRSRLAVAIAVGLHAAVIGAAFVAASMKTSPPATLEDGVVVKWRGDVTRGQKVRAVLGALGRDDKDKKTQKPDKLHPGARPLHLQRPRSMMADEVAAPVEPESISVPAQADATAPSGLPMAAPTRSRC